jgi:SAM-dependent methyltransferase
MTIAPHGGSPSIEQPDYWWYRVRSGLLRIVFEPHLGVRERVLDVGSADGPSVGWLRGSVHVTVDIDPRGLEPGGVCASALALPFRDDSFDVVGAFDVIEHLDPESAAVAELTRVLRPGGRLLVAVPAYQWAWTDFDVQNGHHRRYTRGRTVAALEAAGLDVQRSTYAFASMFPIFAAERLTRRVVTLVRRDKQTEAADIVEVPQTTAWQDRILMTLGRIDAWLLGRVDLPFGSSVFAVAVKRRRPGPHVTDVAARRGGNAART